MDPCGNTVAGQKRKSTVKHRGYKKAKDGLLPPTLL